MLLTGRRRNATQSTRKPTNSPMALPSRRWAASLLASAFTWCGVMWWYGGEVLRWCGAWCGRVMVICVVVWCGGDMCGVVVCCVLKCGVLCVDNDLLLCCAMPTSSLASHVSHLPPSTSSLTRPVSPLLQPHANHNPGGSQRTHRRGVWRRGGGGGQPSGFKITSA